MQQRSGLAFGAGTPGHVKESVMGQRIATRLKLLGIDLPAVRPPAASYLPYTRTGPLVYVAGQICQAQAHPLCMGKVGGAKPPPA